MLAWVTSEREDRHVHITKCWMNSTTLVRTIPKREKYTDTARLTLPSVAISWIRWNLRTSRCWLWELLSRRCLFLFCAKGRRISSFFYVGHSWHQNFVLNLQILEQLNVFFFHQSASDLDTIMGGNSSKPQSPQGFSGQWRLALSWESETRDLF